jgi:hypothetical protein
MRVDSSERHFYSDLKYRSFLGLAHFYKSLYDKAIVDFNNFLEPDPKLADTYIHKVMALEAYAALIRCAPSEAKERTELVINKSGKGKRMS